MDLIDSVNIEIDLYVFVGKYKCNKLWLFCSGVREVTA